ncbi:hypothetical protein [Paenarthrobacter sp. A20]|uniref:hypothetical protein n=1 Tax=Paenarthrobacter sp. A20 TaxID=2817891 RepID=UPI0020A1BABE|nr:hypothetical protein [Paenarthrobacter sp. A20]MCP1415450.1 hypothetical protein [Paenarthrobacter sp. A20]
MDTSTQFLIAFLLCVCLLVAVWIGFASYRRVSPELRALLEADSAYRFVQTRYLERTSHAETGKEFVRINREHSAPVPLLFRRALYLYVGHKPRGGLLNLDLSNLNGRHSTSLIIIDTRDLLAQNRPESIRYRKYDGALAIIGGRYEGPARIIDAVSHREARRRLEPPATTP